MRALLIALAVLGCRPQGEAMQPRLRIAVWGSLEKLSPTPTSSFTNLVQELVFEPIARVDRDGHLAPALVATLTRIDRRRFRIVPRADRRFSDGSRLTLDDLVHSVEAQGLQTVREQGSIIVEAPANGVPVETLLSQVLVSRRSGDRILGTGPFVLAEQKDDYLVLVRLERIPHRISEIVLLRFETPKDAFVHTLKGDADLLPQVDPRWIEFFEGVPRFQIIRGKGINTQSIALSLSLAPVERARLAGILASDAVRTAAFGATCERVASADRSQESQRRGTRSLDILSFRAHERFAFAARRALGREGGDVLLVDNMQEYASRLAQAPLATANILTWPPSMLALTFHSRAKANVLRYSNPEVDAAFDAGDWAQARRLLAKDAPVVFVCSSERVVAIDARVKNPTIGTYAQLDDLPDWELAE